MKKFMLSLTLLSVLIVCVFAVSANAQEVIDGNTYTAICDGTDWTWDAGAKTLTYSKGNVEVEGSSVPDSWTLTFSLSGSNLTWTGYTDNCETTLDDVIVPSFVQVDDQTTYSVVACNKPAENKKTIQSVKMYDGITSIAWAAFRGCNQMISCDLPQNVTKIDGNAFAQCSLLQSIVLPESAKELGASIFYRCSGLESAYIYSEGLTEIPEGMFNECTKLKVLEYPDTVTSLGKSAFGKTTFEKFDFTGITSIGDSCFQWSSTAGFVIPETVTNIGNYAFQSNSVKYFVFEGKNAPQMGTNQGIRDKANGFVYVPANSTGYEDAFAASFNSSRMTLKYYGVCIDAVTANETGYTVSYTYNDLGYITDNTDITYQNDKLIIALYDADDMLVKVATVSPSETTVDINTDKAISYAKIFALDSIDSLKPLYESYTMQYIAE